ncbi:MAG: type II toxin-antitoxin system prevent-host-death family antitoxin [Aquificales bacterium]|nr:type II toxin-antitoxin system prevent-host-death family antitoxin [Aquificales bacterium]
MLKTRERIITTQDLAEGTQKAISNAQSEPLVVTENGRPAAYLISVDLFDAIIAQLSSMDDAELRTNIEAGEQQFTQGAYKTLAEAADLAEQAWQTLTSAE